MIIANPHIGEYKKKYGNPHIDEVNYKQGMTSEDLRRLGAGLDGVGSIMGGLSDIETAKTNRVTDRVRRSIGESQARTLLRNAQKRMAAGGREAREIHRGGRRLVSDATTGMAASGTAVDPVELAKIKQKTDYNALAALFDAGSESRGMELQAVIQKSGTGMDYAAAATNYRKTKQKKVASNFRATSKFLNAWD